jgi:hypothetical protein
LRPPQLAASFIRLCAFCGFPLDDSPSHISTNYVERSNLTLRISSKRLDHSGASGAATFRVTGPSLVVRAALILLAATYHVSFLKFFFRPFGLEFTGSAVRSSFAAFSP